MNLSLLADPLIIFGLGIGLTAIVIIGILSILWIIALIDAVMNPRLNETEKIIWVLVVLFMHILGTILYFLFGRKGSRSGPGPVT